MIENDMTNPGKYGSCEIKHGESISWVMEDRQIFNFEYVNAFNLGDQASGIDQNDDVIARYEAHTDKGNYYLMLNCDLWENEHQSQQRKSIFWRVVKATLVIGLIVMLAWYFKPDLSLEECEAKYGHLSGIGQEENYLPSEPEEEACFATIEAERLRQEEAAEEAERIRLEEEARLAAIEAERIAAEEAAAAAETERIRLQINDFLLT